MSEEVKKSKKDYWMKILRVVITTLAAAAVGYAAAHFGLIKTEEDQKHVEAIQTVVYKTVADEELTEKEAAAATTGAVVVTGKIVAKQQEKKAEATPAETKK